MTDAKALAEKILGIVNAPQKYSSEIESLLAEALEEAHQNGWEECLKDQAEK